MIRIGAGATQTRPRSVAELHRPQQYGTRHGPVFRAVARCALHLGFGHRHVPAIGLGPRFFFTASTTIPTNVGVEARLRVALLWDPSETIR